MIIKLDFTPDLVGVWWRGKEDSANILDGNFSVFLMYLEKEEDYKNSKRGKSIDNLGLAYITNYRRTPTEISFDKKYFETLPQAPLKPSKNLINYYGRGGLNFYHGGWREECGGTGIFFLGDSNHVMEADNPVARTLIRYETTRLMRILENMQEESPFLPLIPSDHVAKQ